MLITLNIIIKGNYIIKLPNKPKTANNDNNPSMSYIISTLRRIYTIFLIFQGIGTHRIPYLQPRDFYFINSISIIGRNIAGSILPTFSFLISSKFMPIPTSRTPPTAVISVITASLRYGATDDASKAMEP